MSGELCNFLWLPSSDLRCTLPAGHTGMHWAKYRIEYRDIEQDGEGEMFWNGAFLELADALEQKKVSG